MSDRVEMVPGDSRRLIAGSASLETCSGLTSTTTCNISHVSVTLKLSTQHIGKGCDRDTYSLESQRKLCGNLTLSISDDISQEAPPSQSDV